MNIKRISRPEINKDKWDDTLRKAYNTMPYGYSWYLDAVCEQWDAIILNDYEAILPLPFVKKMGLRLYIQPLFCQQLGPFSEQPLSEEQFIEILNHLPKNALRLNLNFSAGITIPEKFNDLNPTPRINQIIDLNLSLESIKNNYHRIAKRDLKSYSSNFSTLEKVENISEVIEFYQEQLESKVQLKAKGYQTALNLFKSAQANKAGYFYRFKNVQTNQWVSKGMVIHDKNRVINLFSATNRSEPGANRKNIDLLIEKFQSNKQVFDFEGSSLPGVNQFFNSFGPQKTTYYSIDKINPLLKLIYSIFALIK